MIVKSRYHFDRPVHVDEEFFKRLDLIRHRFASSVCQYHAIEIGENPAEYSTAADFRRAAAQNTDGPAFDGYLAMRELEGAAWSARMADGTSYPKIDIERALSLQNGGAMLEELTLGSVPTRTNMYVNFDRKYGVTVDVQGPESAATSYAREIKDTLNARTPYWSLLAQERNFFVAGTIVLPLAMVLVAAGIESGANKFLLMSIIMTSTISLLFIAFLFTPLGQFLFPKVDFAMGLGRRKSELRSKVRTLIITGLVSGLGLPIAINILF